MWWIPQIPGEYFTVPVGSPREGRLMVDTLARYDAFQYEHRIKPDYSNVGGLHVFEGGEWEDWSDEDGDEITHKKYAPKEIPSWPR